MKKKPDRRLIVAVLVLFAGAAAAKGLEAQRSVAEASAPAALGTLVRGAS